MMRRIVGRIGTAANSQPINMMVYTPAKATRPVPLILMINFGGGPPVEGRPATNMLPSTNFEACRYWLYTPRTAFA